MADPNRPLYTYNITTIHIQQHKATTFDRRLFVLGPPRALMHSMVAPTLSFFLKNMRDLTPKRIARFGVVTKFLGKELVRFPPRLANIRSALPIILAHNDVGAWFGSWVDPKRLSMTLIMTAFKQVVP